MRTTSGLAFALSALVVGTAAREAGAQTETALRAAFEGKTVTVKIDMPATSQGVDVYPLEPMPVDFREVAQRLKDNGTALKMGQQVMITKVLVKRNSHIEFQLGGGGYGTFGDWVSSPTATSATAASETPEERALRERIKASGDKDEKKRLERELASARSERERENARAANEAQQTRIASEALVRSKRAEAGSRFNVRYKPSIPAEALTPEGIMKALAQYLEFPGAPATVAAARPSAPAAQAAQPAPAAGGLSSLKKGLALADVEALLGPAATAGEAQEGSMTIAKRTYRKDGMRVAASFVGGVLVDFTISPQ